MSRLAHTVVAGNFWLRDELAETVRKIIVIPTTVPVREDLIKLAANTLPLQIGWIGLKDNFRSLRLLDDAFALLGDRHPGQAQLTVVSSEPYRTTSIKTRFLPWSVERERTDVAQFDIGIMPLEDHPFVNGKCAFKAILCMAHGIPVVATPVGVNVSVIGHGRNGFLAETTDEWVEHLSSLVSDVELRRSLGSAALETVRTDFNFDCGLERLAAVLDAAADS
jgi:glycosyltransferase involved in cell wall biosynthesis